jgi:K(+)-stimulated pyrophosphate-energized sodium pump
MNANTLFWIAPFASMSALFFAWYFYKSMMKSSEGTARMKEIAKYVREGAMAYISSQYKTVGKIFIILVILLTIMAYFGIQNPFVPVAFLTGGFF